MEFLNDNSTSAQTLKRTELPKYFSISTILGSSPRKNVLYAVNWRSRLIGSNPFLDELISKFILEIFWYPYFLVSISWQTIFTKCFNK